MRLDGDQKTARVPSAESVAAGLSPEHEEQQDFSGAEGLRTDIAETSPEVRGSVDPDLPYKRRLDPTFGYFADRMGIDPHDVSFHYELSWREKSGDEHDAPERQRFTNLHDLQEAMGQDGERSVPVVELKLPQAF